MKTLFNSILFVAFTIVLSAPVSYAGTFNSSAPDKGANYSLTTLKLSPKQFSRAYRAEKREYKSIKNDTFRRMMKKRHGSRLYRWFQRNF